MYIKSCQWQMVLRIPIIYINKEKKKKKNVINCWFLDIYRFLIIVQWLFFIGLRLFPVYTYTECSIFQKTVHYKAYIEKYYIFFRILFLKIFKTYLLNPHTYNFGTPSTDWWKLNVSAFGILLYHSNFLIKTCKIENWKLTTL